MSAENSGQHTFHVDLHWLVVKVLKISSTLHLHGKIPISTQQQSYYACMYRHSLQTIGCG